MKVGAFQPLPTLARSRVPRSPTRREAVARKVVAFSNSLLLSWRALAEKLQPSARGELEITDLNRLYLEDGQLAVEVLGRGTAWFDAGTHDSLLDASQFVAAVQRRQGLYIACLEEIAMIQGFLSAEEILARHPESASAYSSYVRSICTAPRGGGG